MQDINLYQLLKFYAKKWRWITSLTLLGATIGLIYNTYVQVPLYQSDATLLVVGENTQKSSQDPTLINNYLELIKSRRVLEPVIERHHQSASYDDLVKTVTATSEKDTEVIKLSIASTNADTSKKLVDGTVESFRIAVKELYNVDNISIVDDASIASEPYNVNQLFQLALTTIAGLMLAIIGLFFVFDLGVAKKTAQKTREPQPQPQPQKAADTPAPQVQPVAVAQEKPSAKRATLNKVVTMIVGDESIAPPPTKKKRRRRSKNKRNTTETN